MKVEATVSFSGPKIAMAPGEIKDITDKALVDDLLRAGYVKKVSGGKVNESKRTATKRCSWVSALG